MHTFFLFVACLSATIATPVAQLFEFFADDAAVTINNKQDINNLPKGFGTGGLEYLSTGLQQLDENDAPPFFAGDATTNYLQAQVPSQDSFSNFGGHCPSGELFCCQGGSGPPGSLFTDNAFSAKCVSYNDENKSDDKCQLESNGACCQWKTAAGVAKVWQCVSTPIEVVPAENEGPDDESQPLRKDPGENPGWNLSIPPRQPNRRPNYGKDNWEGF